MKSRYKCSCDNIIFISTCMNFSFSFFCNILSLFVKFRSLDFWSHKFSSFSTDIMSFLPGKRFWDLKIQKQPPRGLPRRRCSENMQKIYRRKPMPNCDFNKVAKYTEITLRHGCSPLNLLHISRTPLVVAFENC